MTPAPPGGSTMSDRRLQLVEAMAGVAAGDRASLHTVYEMTSTKLFATIVRIVRGRERAEDLLQEVYVKAWRRAGRFDPAKGSPITWLCTIARNTALNDLRRESRSAELAGDELPEVADETVLPADEAESASSTGWCITSSPTSRSRRGMPSTSRCCATR
ncbi:sigma-70 family RNA polymerase sigma factor [Croceicoccus sp. F390]|uniref:RNA polymerase sigma factor n=1 Tax=Croceicoccus esteveae TaxID=3075597 RepID=A0ABU2ZIC9_9SPHN|nr:sigma-70 family RNA polymerase sigma factor [Croceicoccus sp. F390]MDT0576368.1 sigma-70 family RNA polymerase sigma factor [Croceicoccus sp. F390]